MKCDSRPNGSTQVQAEMGRFLKLKDRTPLNQGHSRLVFAHPGDPALVVKVMRPDVLEARFGSETRWYKRGRRYGRYVSYVRELQEYIAAHSTYGYNPPFLQTVIGLVDTDLGLGLITEAATDADGNLAPNLATLIASGSFDSTARKNLDHFLQQILDCNVVISDMNVGNLVYAFSEQRGNFFVLIDGMGNANPLPFKAISRRISRRSKLRRFERLYNRIRMRLDKAGYPMPPLPKAEL